MGVADGQSVSFSDFWTLIQSVATSQHSLLSGQGGPSCSCILLWPVRHSIFIITNFVLREIPLSQCVTCPCPRSSRCSTDSTGQCCSEQKLLQEYRIATIKMRSQSSRFPNYFISVVFLVLFQYWHDPVTPLVFEKKSNAMKILYILVKLILKYLFISMLWNVTQPFLSPVTV